MIYVATRDRMTFLRYIESRGLTLDHARYIAEPRTLYGTRGADVVLVNGHTSHPKWLDIRDAVEASLAVVRTDSM